VSATKNASAAPTAALVAGTGADDLAYGVALDPSGNIYLTGATLSANYPTTPGAFRTASSGGYPAARS
jgi:Beta-propeller repeat